MGGGQSRNKKKKTSPDIGGSQPNLNNPRDPQQRDFFTPRERSPEDIRYEDINNSPNQASPNPGLNRPGRQLNSNASAPVFPKSQTLNASKISQDPNASTVNVPAKGKKTGPKNTIVPASLRAPCRVIGETWADRIYFDEKELKRLRKRFAMVDYDQRGEITVEQLGNIIELISSPFRERIMNLAEDRLNSERRNRLSFDEFARILSVWNHKCPIDIKMKYFFRMYDINGDNYVDDKDIATMLKYVFFVREMKEQDGDGVFETSLTNDEFVEKMAKDIIATYDINQDKTLDLNEFKNMFLDGDVETRMNITF